ncbi:FAD-binding protein [Streptomyces sp. t39]|uniref:FAD-binding protein n=1 Tax=Streptomyces sp. t39 TaxID=1828156 RepID=UPI003967CEAD
MRRLAAEARGESGAVRPKGGPRGDRCVRSRGGGSSSYGGVVGRSRQRSERARRRGAGGALTTRPGPGRGRPHAPRTGNVASTWKPPSGVEAAVRVPPRAACGSPAVGAASGPPSRSAEPVPHPAAHRAYRPSHERGGRAGPAGPAGTALLSRIWQTPEPIERFKKYGEDFVVASSLPELVHGMNRLTGDNLIDLADLQRQIEARDREITNPYTKDLQVMGIRNALAYPGDTLSRTASVHRILDPDAAPLIAVRLNILTRKTLGGLQTDLSGRVLNAAGQPIPGLYAAGEVAGFGGGGVHGYGSLEGTFLGGCLFSGRVAGRAAAAATG